MLQNSLYETTLILCVAVFRDEDLRNRDNAKGDGNKLNQLPDEMRTAIASKYISFIDLLFEGTMKANPRKYETYLIM